MSDPSEAYANPLTQSVAEGIYRIDLSGVCTDANQACARLLGYETVDELLGRNMHKLVHHHHSDGVEYDEADCRVAIATRDMKMSHVDDEVFWRKDGTSFPVEYWSTPDVRDGEIVGCKVNFIDITSPGLVERQLAKNEQRWRFAMEASNVCLWEWNMITGQVSWSPQLFHLLGYQPASFLPSVQNFWELCHADDRERIEHMMVQANDSQCTNHQMEFRVRGADGTYFWMHCRGRVDRSLDGKPLYLTCVAIDVTSAHRAHDELAEARQRLEVGIALAGLAVCDVDYASNLVHLSNDAAKLYGLGETAMSIPREQLYRTFHPDDLNQVIEMANLFVVGTSGPEFDCKHRVVLPGGKVRWLHVRKRHYEFGPTVRHRRAILAARDITFEQEAQLRIEQSARQAESANAAKSSFLASMSHEIRTPMAAILGYTELLLSDPEVNEHQSEQLEVIHRNGTHLLSVIDDILDLSKIESGKLDVFQEHVEPLRIVEDIRSLMEVRASERSIALEVIYAGSIPHAIQTDGKRLKQILFNLVGNAIKFTPEGKVTIRLSSDSDRGKLQRLKQEGTITFEVCDTGIGMSDELLRQLFEPFAQGHKEISRDYGGTGLGLAISQRLARLLGGEIDVDSSLGEGSQFRLRLPIGKSDPSLQTETPGPREQFQRVSETVAKPLFSCHVLVVDDRRDVRVLTTTVLHKQGATTEQAEDGEKAVEKVQRSLQNGRPYDLVVLDMQMPRLDGYRTARQLRTMGFEGPIIALTAEAMQGDLERCLEAGCNSYLSKPVNIPLFTATVFDHFYKQRDKNASMIKISVQPRHGY